MIATLFDTETTGLIDNHVVKLVNQSHVIEFYALQVNLETGEKLHELHRVIKPPIEITEKITEITGITNEMVADAPTMGEALPLIIQFLESAPAVIAHNLSFDMEMMDIECERVGQKINWPRTKICTVEQTEWVRGYRLSLSALHEMLFWEKFEGAHRANVDVAALLRCCVELKRKDWI